ncbi:MAG: hypothetical protein AAF703_20620 [Cyanobacteria bacterium P01_D01_bin.105]
MRNRTEVSLRLCATSCAMPKSSDRLIHSFFSHGQMRSTLSTSFMTPHNIPNSRPLEQLLERPLEEDNLVRVRKDLTPYPQNSLADLQVSSTSYSLEIQFSQKRLRSFPVFNLRKMNSEQSNAADSDFFNPVMLAATVLLVGGTIALTHSVVFGILVAIAIPICQTLLTSEQGPAQSRTATLRFVNTPQNQTLLSLTSAPSSRATAPNMTLSHWPSPARAHETTVHFSNLPVKLVSAKTYVTSGQLSLTLYASGVQGKDRIRITGTRQEIHWLHSRIKRWGQETLSHQIA